MSLFILEWLIIFILKWSIIIVPLQYIAPLQNITKIFLYQIIYNLLVF